MTCLTGNSEICFPSILKLSFSVGASHFIDVPHTGWEFDLVDIGLGSLGKQPYFFAPGRVAFREKDVWDFWYCIAGVEGILKSCLEIMVELENIKHSLYVTLCPWKTP